MPRGGKRKGSGRKPDPNKKLKKSITITPDHMAWLKDKNASQEIEKALEKHIGEIEMEKYRKDEYGKVYEYDEEEKAYFFIGKLNGQSLKQFITDYEYQINMMISEGKYDH